VKIREALRLKSMKISNVEISRSISCSRTTLIDLFHKCDDSGLDYTKAAQMTDHELDELIYPQMNQSKVQIPDPDFKEIHEELERYGHVNRKLLWTEYQKRTPNGLAYSQFCERYRRWCQTRGENLTMVIERKAGDTMEVDWAGEMPPLLCDRETGELKPICLFVASVGYSGRLYAEAFTDMALKNWITAHTHALVHYGARPRIVTPDNTKTAVKRHVRYDPVLNRTYLEWAEFYELAVIPARPRKPKDKPIVEGGVGWLETWVLGRLRHRYFFSLSDLNQEIRQIMSELDVTAYQKRAGTRLSVFQEVDLPAMRPLPAGRFERPEFKDVTVGTNYHVDFDFTQYSVPYTYCQKRVTIRATDTTVEVLYDNLRICSHPRNYNPRKRYATITEHMPEKHHRYLEQNDWTGDRYRSWASKVGMNTFAVIDAMLRSHAIEEQMYKSCMGVMQLSRKYSEDRLESACLRARQLGSFSYTTVKNILKNGQDLIPLNSPSDQFTVPDHGNIRGSQYYK